jgi:hypothetical protein
VISKYTNVYETQSHVLLSYLTHSVVTATAGRTHTFVTDWMFITVAFSKRILTAVTEALVRTVKISKSVITHSVNYNSNELR